MAMKKPQKVKVVEALSRDCNVAELVVLGDNKGLKVADVTDLRSKLRGKVIRFSVVKNTLLGRASEGTSVALLKSYFKGATMVLLAKGDPVAPAKVLKDFKKGDKPFALKAALLDGTVISIKQLEALADLPSREELLSTLMGTMQAPVANAAGLLKNVMGTFVSTVDAYREKREKEAA